jgi:hypothetical protein
LGARSSLRGCTTATTTWLGTDWHCPKSTAKELQVPYELVKEVAVAGKLPAVLFTAGGIVTPADAAMMMQLGARVQSWVRGSSRRVARRGVRRRS